MVDESAQAGYGSAAERGARVGGHAREPVLWMVVHHDTHGTGGVVREGLDEAEAQAMADAYEARGHHQGYTAIPYTPSTKGEVMARERVLP